MEIEHVHAANAPKTEATATLRKLQIGLASCGIKIVFVERAFFP